MDEPLISNRPPKRGSIRTGGRTERVRKQVADAVLELVASGRHHFEIKEIVEKTGLHRTTISRRWPTRQDLLAEAFREHTAKVQIVDTGHWRSDLLCMGLVLRNFFADPREQAFNASLAMATSPDGTYLGSSYWDPIQAQMDRLIERAQARGEVRSDVNQRLIENVLISPLIVTIMLQKVHPTDQFVTNLVDLVVRATKPDEG